MSMSKGGTMHEWEDAEWGDDGEKGWNEPIRRTLVRKFISENLMVISLTLIGLGLLLLGLVLAGLQVG